MVPHWRAVYEYTSEKSSLAEREKQEANGAGALLLARLNRRSRGQNARSQPDAGVGAAASDPMHLPAFLLPPAPNQPFPLAKSFLLHLKSISPAPNHIVIPPKSTQAPPNRPKISNPQTLDSIPNLHDERPVQEDACAAAFGGSIAGDSPRHAARDTRNTAIHDTRIGNNLARWCTTTRHGGSSSMVGTNEPWCTCRFYPNY